MCVYRQRGAQRAQHVDLQWRVVEMVVAADRARDADVHVHVHVHVIDHNAEIVGRIAVRARNNQVIQLDVLEHNTAVHLIVDDDRACEGIFIANDRLDARPRSHLTSRCVFVQYRIATSA